MDDVAQVMPLFAPPAFKLTVTLVIWDVVVVVRRVKESVLVAEKPGPRTVEEASMPSPRVTIGVVEETARVWVAKMKGNTREKMITATVR